MRIYSLTDTGMVRQNNQDDMKSGVVNDSVSWAVVCDGMGGANGGDFASRTAADTFSEIVGKAFAGDSYDIVATLTEAINAANTSVYNAAQDDPMLMGMGTTVAAAVVSGKELTVAHAGDSRAYLIDSSGIRQITVDHSLVQEMVDCGRITAEQAKNHPRKNIITRALGVTDEVEIDFDICTIEDNSVVLICSDGLTNFVEDGEIEQIVKSTPHENVPKALIDRANENGGGDNITAVVMCCSDGKDE